MNVIFLVLTILGLIIAFLLLLFALATGKKRLRNFLLIGIPLWILIYGILLIGASFQSRTYLLPNNRAKQFCGIFGCGLEASVTSVRKTQTIGNLKAQGIFYIVKVKITNDSDSKTLAMTNPEAVVSDESGRFYSRKEDAEKLLPQGASIAFNQPVSPKGSFEKEIVFDVSDPAKNLNLSLTDTHGINRLIETFLIGDEESLFHKPTLFIVELDTAS